MGVSPSNFETNRPRYDPFWWENKYAELKLAGNDPYGEKGYLGEISYFLGNFGQFSNPFSSVQSSQTHPDDRGLHYGMQVANVAALADLPVGAYNISRTVLNGTRALNGVNKAQDAIEATRVAGVLYGEQRLAKLSRYLEKRGVILKVGDEFLDADKVGGLAYGRCPAELLLRSNPTKYEVWHELGHYIQRQRIGPEAYANLPRYPQNVPEQFVFDLLENYQRRWSLLNFEEQQHAIRYVQSLSVGGIR